LSEAAPALDYTEDVKQNWHLVEIPPGVNTGTDYDPPLRLRIPKHEFRSGSHCLLPIRPVQITLFEEEGCFIAYNENLHIWAAGDTSQYAIQDFEEQVVYFYFHYKEKPGKSLVGTALHLQNLYSESFEEAK
jgi:hypothetical protein